MKANYLITVAAFICLIGKLSAQVPNWLWAQSGGGAANDYGTSVITDMTGNVYVAGHFSSNPYAVFGSDTLTNVSGSDMFIAKYDASGNLLWARSAGGDSTDNANDIYCDAAGNVYMTGSSNSTSLAFGSIVLTGNGSHDIIVAKYDSSGNIIWAFNFGNAGDESASEISGISGNIYLTGSFRSATITFGTYTLNNAGSSTSDVFIANLDTAGNTLWAHSAGSSAYDHANGISVDAAGNIFVAGYFSGSATFGSTILSSAGAYDIFLAKYNSSGNVLWAVRTGGTAYDNAARVCNDMAGNAYIAGTFASSNMTFAGTPFTFAGGLSDILILKYDSAGNEIWGKFAGGASSDGGFGISTDPAGNICATGQFIFSITFGSTTLTTAGFLDIFIVKFDASGNVLWATRAGGSTGADVGYGIATDNSSSTYISGYFGSTSVSFGSSTLTSTGMDDAFVAKLDTSNVITGTQMLPSGISFSLMPNPASVEIKVMVSNITGIEIFNTLGEKVYSDAEVFQSNVETINVSKLSSGIYFVKVRTSERMNTGKFVKE